MVSRLEINWDTDKSVFFVIVKTDGSIAALTETVTGTSVANVLSAP